MYSILKLKAIKLRSKGFSINEISSKLEIPKSTILSWVKDVVLNTKAKRRIQERGNKGRKNGTKTIRLKRQKLIKEIYGIVFNKIKNINLDQSTKKLLCAMLFWCEGSKVDNMVSLINSDPLLIKTFLWLLRSSFNLKESKFRANLHLHPYHNKKRQIKFWSDITKIPPNQFMKPYIKSNGGNNIKKGYPGCVVIRYYDHKVALELRMFYELFGKK